MSWLNSLLASLGSAGSTALDEASLVGRGMYEETVDPLNIGRMDSTTQPDKLFSVFGEDAGPYRDQAAGQKYDDQNFQEKAYNLFSALDAPHRAIDRAFKTYTGDTLFDDRPSMRSPFSGNSAMSGVANQEQGDPTEALARIRAGTESDMSSEPAGLAERLHALNVNKMQAKDTRAEDEVMARLAALQNMSGPDTLSFAATGDRVRSGPRPQMQMSPESQMYDSNQDRVRSYQPTQGGSFSQLQRPTVEQETIRKLGMLGIPQQGAEAAVDNMSQQDARMALSELSKRQLTSKQDMARQAIDNYQTAVSKSANPQQVQAALVIQLRNIGFDDMTIKTMLMSLGAA